MAQQDAEEEVLDDKPKNLIFHLVKQLTTGQDLTKVLIPTFFLEPRSFLERLSDLMAHPQYLLGVASVQDPLERMLRITRWYLSGWHVRPKSVKKPYNPLLGEVFYCYWDHTDNSRSIYVAEQVVHHPPISAVYVENRKHNLTMNAQIWTKSKFLGNSAASINVGEANFHLCNLGEVYVMDFPTAYACGLFLGRLRMELGGKQTIKCEKSGLICEIEFKTKPMFGGDYNRIAGKIRSIKDESKVFYSFEGKWDGVITFKDAKGKEEVFFDADNSTILKKFVSKIENQGEWESRRVWVKVTEALRKNDHDEATKEKTRLEDAQRERKREREEKNTPYVTKHFHLVNDKWVYKNIKTNPWTADEPESKLPVEAKAADDDSGLPPGFNGAVEDLSVSDKPAGSSATPAPRPSAAEAPKSSTANILGL